MEVEKFVGMSFYDYTQIDALNASGLRCFELDGPEVYYRKCVARTEDDPKGDDYRKGRIFHTRMQHGMEWLNEVFRFPSEILGEPLNRRKPSHRAEEAEILEMAAEKHEEVLYDKDVDEIESWGEAIDECLVERDYHLWEYESEVVFVATLPNGAKAKCMIDRYYSDCPIGSTVMDFKTTKEKEPIAFCRAGRKLGYLHQAAWYLMITGASRYVVVPVTKTDPPKAFIKVVQPQILGEYAKNNQATMEKLMQCKEWEKSQANPADAWEPTWKNLETFWSDSDRYGD